VLCFLIFNGRLLFYRFELQNTRSVLSDREFDLVEEDDGDEDYMNKDDDSDISSGGYYGHLHYRYHDEYEDFD